MYRASREAFSVMDIREVKLVFTRVHFNESQPVPADSKIVSYTWAKANKDGSQDRRFANNYQIPIALYGELAFTSSRGLNEEFQFSSCAAAERFAKSWYLLWEAFT